MDHQAFAQLLGNYGEFLGSIGVMATLIYLAIQIRQQNLESQAKSVHEILSGFRDAQMVWIDREIAELSVKRQQEGVDALGEAERVWLLNALTRTLRVWEEAFHYHRNGRLDEELWEAIVTQNQIILGTEGSRAICDMRRHTFTKSFAEFVDTLEPGVYRVS